MFSDVAVFFVQMLLVLSYWLCVVGTMLCVGLFLSWDEIWMVFVCLGIILK